MTTPSHSNRTRGLKYATTVITILEVIIVAMLISCQPQGVYQSGGAMYGSATARSYDTMAHHFGRGRVPLAITPGEELWIISRGEAIGDSEADDVPGSGALVATLPGETETVPVPLKHTDVTADIHGYIATVQVQQQFHNPYDEKIEAQYVFPLPQNAAVNGFVMTIGDRHIRGIIREREQAEQIYRDARAQGHVASLLTQERPNIFTQKVANIEPGKQIDIDIRYFHTLQYVDGYYEFVFPMVVGPRYNPIGSTNGVGAVARNRSGASGQSTEVSYLRPNERSGHDIALAVNIDAGVAINEIESVNHVITNSHAGNHATVRLSDADAIPNKDFVLRYRVAGDQITSGFIAQADPNGQGGYFTLMVHPPQYLQNLERKPMEMIFVLDCSGSMSGRPIKQVKQAITHALDCMQPNDTFQIILFSNNASQLGREPLPATASNIRRGKRFLQWLSGSGGTAMIEGVKAALDFPHDPQRLRTVAFMTDGYIGNENDILHAVNERLGASRIFSFGVGSSPNRYLLDRLALMGRGAVAYLSLNDDATTVMDTYFQRISHPAMTDVTIDFGGLDVVDVYPARQRDLFVGRPIIVTGRYRGALQPTTVRITGKAGEHDVETSLAIDRSDVRDADSGIGAVWARMKIADLNNAMTASGSDPHGEWEQSIRRVALDHSLMSAYTAFVAVDSSTRTSGTHGTTVPVAVPVPDGVRYDTTVTE